MELFEQVFLRNFQRYRKRMIMLRMRIPEWIFEGEFAKVWAKWEDDEEASHA